MGVLRDALNLLSDAGDYLQYVDNFAGAAAAVVRYAADRDESDLAQALLDELFEAARESGRGEALDRINVERLKAHLVGAVNELEPLF